MTLPRPTKKYFSMDSVIVKTVSKLFPYDIVPETKDGVTKWVLKPVT